MKKTKSINKIYEATIMYGDDYALSPEMINIIKDGIISYIKEELIYSEKYDTIDSYYDNNDVQNLFKSFIFDQMVFSHYSIVRNGKEVLVSHNTNIDNITEEEIREYISNNALLEKYLKDLLYKFYFEHVDIPCITKHSIQNAIKLKKEFEKDGENFDKWDAVSVVQNIIDSIYCPSIYFSDVLSDNDLHSFLQQEFNKADIIPEQKKNKKIMSIKQPFKEALLESFSTKIKETIKNKIIKKKLNENETAYHGSSNYFTSFKKEGIGGGAGAQAFGWGLYFGKNPEIAKGYMSMGPNSYKKKNLFQGKTAEELGFEYENEIFFSLPSDLKTPQDYIDFANDAIEILEYDEDFEGKEELINNYKRFIDIIKDMEIEQEDMRYLYKVTLFPNKTPDYLNWDKPLPQEQLDKINQQIQKDDLNLQIKPNTKGETVYNLISNQFKSPEKASMFLLKAGIDGVTHSNESIRIVFDDSQIKIDKIYKAKEAKDVTESKKHQLNEYSQKIIDQLIAKWQKEMRNTLSNDDIKVKINRFDQIKQNIPTKIKAGNIVVPDKFTKPDPKTNKVANPSDILNYTWKELEAVLDAYGEKATKTSDKFYTVQDADFVEVKGVPVVYSGNGVKVYEGSNYDSCVKLNYVFKYKGEDDKIYTYSFCIGRKEDASNQYYSYRFGRGGDFRSFYFVADTTQSADIKGNPTDRANFLNWYHLFVIHAFDDGKFGVTDAVNQYGSNHEKIGITWEEVGQFMIKNGGESGQKAWDKIKNQKDIFKYVPPSNEETDQALVRDQILNTEQFSRLTRNQKAIYIARRAKESRSFNSEMFKTLDSDLKNLAIQNGFSPTYLDINNNAALGRAYARFKFKRALDYKKTHGDIDTSNIVPLPFVKFLNDTEKQQYLDTFDKGLTFEYIEKYFGSEVASRYINDLVSKLEYVPTEAIKYISNPKLKQLYTLYSKLTSEWKGDDDFNIGDEELENLKSMPEQRIYPSPINAEQWLALSPAERKTSTSLANKFNQNLKYATLSHAVPFFVRDNGKMYALLPDGKGDGFGFEQWVLIDENGRIVKNNISGDSTLEDTAIYTGRPSGFNDYKKVFDISEFDIK